MIVQKLKMYNFRCFSSFEIVFSNKINILLGRNATGKTSILEAINYLALTKSFRTNDESQLVKEQQNEMSVIGEIIKDKSTCFCKIIRQVKGKQVSRMAISILRLVNIWVKFWLFLLRILICLIYWER